MTTQLWIMAIILFLLSMESTSTVAGDVPKRPNIVFILGDDVGVGDLASYGHPSQEWGAIDKMATEGVRFTQAYSSARFCTPSRASILTGRLPVRTGLIGPQVILEYDHAFGLPHSEITMAEVLRDAGYKTGMVGKWHLGNNAFNHNDGTYLPHNRGFDYVGTVIPHTLAWDCDNDKRHKPHAATRKCFLYQNSTIIQQPIQFHNLTAQMIMDAKAFLYNSAADSMRTDTRKPFFLYFSLLQTHTPMFNDNRFKGKSKRGIYGDQVNEMAWAVGEVLNTLQELRLERDTLTVFVSDHGPHMEICGEGGSPGFFRGGKGYFREGGLRVPAIMQWPGVIPAGIVDSTLISLMDFFPTFLSLAGTSVPQDRHIDGKNLLHLFNSLSAITDLTHHEILHFYCETLLAAVRFSHYKVYYYDIKLPSEETVSSYCRGDFPVQNKMVFSCAEELVKLDPIQIFNVDADPHELYPLPVGEYLSMLEKVEALIGEHKKTMLDIPEPMLQNKDRTLKVIPCCNVPYCVC